MKDQLELPIDPLEALTDRLLTADRAGCSCSGWRKPCVYHEGMRDGYERLIGEITRIGGVT